MNIIKSRKWKTLLVLIIVGLICLLLVSRYQHVNKFYIEYPTEKKKAYEELFDGHSVSVHDARKAGVKYAQYNSDDSAFIIYFNPKIDGHEYSIFSLGSGTAYVAFNSDTDSAVVITYKGKYSVLDKGPSSPRTLAKMGKNTSKYMLSSEKKVYDYWQNHKLLRFEKMIPGYE